MGASARRRAAGRGRGGYALVCSDPPAAGSGFVDRAPDDRVPEPESSRHVGSSHEVDPHELVQPEEDIGFCDVRSDRGEIELERIARHRRPVEDCPSVVWQSFELLRQSRCDKRWNPQPGKRDFATGSGLRGLRSARQLLQLEGVAATLFVQGVDVLADEVMSLFATERRELEPPERAVAMGTFECRR